MRGAEVAARTAARPPLLLSVSLARLRHRLPVRLIKDNLTIDSPAPYALACHGFFHPNAFDAFAGLMVCPIVKTELQTETEIQMENTQIYRLKLNAN